MEMSKTEIVDKMDGASMYIFMGCLMVTLSLAGIYKAQFTHGVPIGLIGITLLPILVAGTIVLVFDHLYYKQKESVSN